MKLEFMGLSDGKIYAIRPGMKVKTICSIPDENWKTQLAKGYANIPEDTELTIIDFLHNCYGNYLKVMYNGHIYYIDPTIVKYINDN